MADVMLDKTVMNDLLAKLGALRDELETADDGAGDLADATGHDGLADAVREFADGWRIRRRELAEMVADTHQQGTAISDSIELFDEQAI